MNTKIGPSYDVWIARGVSPFTILPSGRYGYDFRKTSWPWVHDARYTCDDDPDGRGARVSAHEYARHLRGTYPFAYVAVLPAGKRPLPVRPRQKPTIINNQS